MSMTKPFPLVLLGLGICLLPVEPGACAQNASAATPAVEPTLEQTLSQLEALDGDLAKKLDGLRSVIDRELTAKHITDAAAQSLKFGLRTLSYPNSADQLANAL